MKDGVDIIFFDDMVERGGVCHLGDFYDTLPAGWRLAAVEGDDVHNAFFLLQCRDEFGTYLAEGAGEFAPREKARFYRIARRSAVECAAILDVAARLGLVRAAQPQAREDLIRIVGGIVRLIQSSERRSGQEQGQG